MYTQKKTNVCSKLEVSYYFQMFFFLFVWYVWEEKVFMPIHVSNPLNSFAAGFINK